MIYENDDTIFYNKCIKEYGNYKVILKDEYLNNKNNYLNMINEMFNGEINEVANIKELEKHLDFIFTKENALLILNTINAEIISMVNAYEYKNKNWCLFSLYVNKKYRNNGESIKILKYLIKYLDKYDYERLISGIEEENKKSIYVHEISGFKNTGYKWNELEDGFPENHLGYEYRR